MTINAADQMNVLSEFRRAIACRQRKRCASRHLYSISIAPAVQEIVHGQKHSEPACISHFPFVGIVKVLLALLPCFRHADAWSWVSRGVWHLLDKHRGAPRVREACHSWIASWWRVHDMNRSRSAIGQATVSKSPAMIQTYAR